MKDFRWITKDPVIDVIRTEAQRYGNLSHSQLAKLSYDSGVSVSTIYNWFNGDTRRPQSLTTRAVLEALSLKVVYQREDGTTVRQPQPEYMSKAEQEAVLREERKRAKEREKA